MKEIAIRPLADRALTAIAVVIVALLAVSGALPSSAAAVVPETPARSAGAIPVPAVVESSGDRLHGADRFETSVAVSQRFAATVPAAFIAFGLDFPDALAGAAAAAHLGGPLLLTRKDHVPLVVLEELRRLQPGKIVVLGGTGVVSDAVVGILANIAPTERISGADRYATSERIVERVFGQAEHIALATGRGFADALSAGGAVASAGAPLLLIDGSRAALPAATLATLEAWGVRSITLAGGHGAIDLHIEQQLRTAGFDVTRVAGESRYETAAALHTHYFSDRTPQTILLTTGADFPDALSAGALAGLTQSSVLLTRPECVPAAPHAILANGGVPRIVVGGTSVVSEAAASNTVCTSTPVPTPQWETTGWTLPTDALIPYADRPPVDVHHPSHRLDETGLRIYLRIDNGQRADHPVAYAQYGISALMQYQTSGDQIWLDRAVRHAERLTQMRTQRDGAWWFPYLFPWTYYERTLTVPWWSAMAQGQALSLFVRLHEETGDDRWRVAADSTWQSFLQSRSAAEPWSTMVAGQSLIFEEYAGNQPPLLVLNGQIFAAFGVYDFWRLTGDPEAARYFDGGATTVLEMMPLVRNPGGVSYYCVQQPYCQSAGWQNPTYHEIHSWQLDTLARLTGDSAFSDWAELLRADSQAPARRGAAPGGVLGWEDGPPQ